MLYKVCPADSSHKTFHTAATIREIWVVDERGNYVNNQDGDGTVISHPSMNSEWTCATCGSVALTVDSEQAALQQQQLQLTGDLHAELVSFMTDMSSGKFVHGQMDKAKELLQRLKG
jgi:hypothetical protein